MFELTIQLLKINENKFLLKINQFKLG